MHNDMLAYFLKVNVVIVLFYAFYRLFFYKDTFFGWRRTALLCFFAIAAAVPLLNIQTWIVEQEPMVAMADLYASVVLPEFTVSPKATVDWKKILQEFAVFAYGGGVLFLTIRFLIQLAGIIRLADRCRTLQIGDSTIHLLPKEGGPFSFFHWIFIYPSSHTEEEFNEILTHEQTHARQWHSIDVVLSEWVCILCWFNPFAWLMKREIRTNLEYMADAHVLENGYDSKTYQYHLLGLSHHKAAATLYNNFNVLPLKKRIKMMNKKRTNKIGRTKYLMFLPLIALLMIISNIEAVARTTKQITAEVIEAVDNTLEKPNNLYNKNDSIPEDVIFEVVEVMPEFLEGGMGGLMKYLNENIRYPKEAQEARTQGRVVIQFVVDTDGSIIHPRILRGVDSSLDKEAIRVASAMPKWKPGTQRGKAVKVKYTVPIIFKLPKEKPAEPAAYAPINGQVEEIVAVGYQTATFPKVEGKVWQVVEHMPEFPGGMQGLMQYISKSIKYPVETQKAGAQGRVIVQMIIDKDGNITEPTVISSVTSVLDAEAIRLVSNMPKWKPGTEKGKPVNVKYTIPIMFKLQ